MEVYPLMTNIAIEHDHRKFVDLPIEHGGYWWIFPVRYVTVYQRVP